MKIEILETKVLYENEHSAHNYIGWPTVAKLCDGKLMMAASGFRVRHVCPYGKAIACLSYDEGKTWTPPMVLIDTILDDRDCGILPFGESSVMVMSLSDTMDYCRDFYKMDENHPRFPRFGRYIEYANAYIKLVEEEENLNEFIGSNFRVSHDNGLTFGPVHNCPPMIPHGPCLLPDGTIFALGNTRADNIHYDRFLSAYKLDPDTGVCELISRIYADDYECFGQNVSICEPYTIVTKSGKMIVQFRVENSDMSIKTTYQCESFDYGKTFTKPRKLFADDTGAAPTHILEHSSGMLIAVHPWRKERGIDAMISTDEGENWETGFAIYRNEKLLDWSYPSSCELSDGSILTVFYADPDGEDQNRKNTKIMQVKWKIVK